MKYPKFISEKSIIGVPAPSDGADSEVKINRYKNAYERFKNLGYEVVISNNLYKSIKGRSSSAQNRANEINDMFKSNIDFILCASGGEFLVEILPFVDFELLKNNPKFVAGFSDPTGLLYVITTKYDIATIYGKNFSNFGSSILHDSEEKFLELMKGNLILQKSYPLYEEEYIKRKTGLESYNLDKEVIWKTFNNEDVNVKGRIIGGCLDVISELSGTKYDGGKEFSEKYKDDGIIWYFDNCELSYEEVIRVLWKFNELGYFKYTKAVIFGRFGVNNTNIGYNINECLSDSVLNSLNIPIIYDADISHKGPSMNIINGAIAKIEVKNGKGKIKFILE